MRIYGLVVGAASAVVMAIPASIHAQAADSSLYVSAQQMVANGEAAQGRRLVDSLLKAAPTGSAQYAEGLYWRATLATNARDSERDYRQIVVDYPLSPRVPDALLRMGELESQRGDREAALQHFQRLTIEHPESPLRAEANYWIARTYLDKNDTAHGCAANASALAQVSTSNVELKNRIAFQQQACRGVAVATPSAATAPAPAAPVASAPSTRPAVHPTTREVPVKTAPVAAPVTEVAESAAATPPVPKPAKVAAKPAVGNATVVTKTTTTTTTTSARRTDTASRTTSTSKAGGYAVQVAAFTSRAQGDALVAKLRARGYSAHLDGTAAPFRVRIGHYATRAAAVAELNQLKAKKMDGFIAEL